MRLFIAVTFSQPIQEKLEGILCLLKEQAFAGNFSSRENLHLTLAFLGDIPSCRLSHVIDAMEQIHTKPFLCSLSSLGCFGKMKKEADSRESSVLWIGTDYCPELLNLQNELTASLRRHAVWYDSKPFRPHVTLGRNVRLNPEFSEKSFCQNLPEMCQQVTGISLMKSERKNNKTVYTELYRKLL